MREWGTTLQPGGLRWAAGTGTSAMLGAQGSATSRVSVTHSRYRLRMDAGVLRTGGRDRVASEVLMHMANANVSDNRC